MVLNCVELCVQRMDLQSANTSLNKKTYTVQACRVAVSKVTFLLLGRCEDGRFTPANGPPQLRLSPLPAYHHISPQYELTLDHG